MNARRLLVFDDDSSICATVSSVAESIGFDVRIANVPDEFFPVLEAWRPTHIALDLVMPTMDGVQVIEILAERNCDAQVLITSGLGGRVLAAAQRSAAEHGLSICGILPKPFGPAKLAELLLKTTVPVPPNRVAEPSSAPTPPRFEVTLANLRHAIHNGQLRMAYQPKVDCTSGRASGFEALVRWMHPDWGVIPPNDFIPFAEQHGLIGALTDVVVDTSLDWFARTCAHVDLSLAVNISAKTLTDLKFADRLVARCKEKDVDPGRLILEVTETSAMEDPLASLDLLTRLRVKGFQLSIDDFGTGFSSMLQLVRLPFSEMKIDRSFVATALRSSEAAVIVTSTVMLASALGLTSTAEGVEDIETLRFLQSVGCGRAQGFLIGRPMPDAGAAAWLAASIAKDAAATA